MHQIVRWNVNMLKNIICRLYRLIINLANHIDDFRYRRNNFQNKTLSYIGIMNHRIMNPVNRFIYNSKIVVELRLKLKFT